MIKRIIYFGIIVILTILLINYFGTKNNFQLSNEETINASELVNNARYNPKRLYLSTWRLVKSKYYDPTLNKQDWYRWRSRYIDKIKTQEDAYVAINTMLASLNDQYSRFMSEDEFKSQNEEIDAKITGIGVTISSISGKIVILDVLKNTPANKAGIKSGDILTKVNGKDVHGLDLSDVSKLIRRSIGSVVGVEFLRDKKKISYNIQRREIEIQSVESEMMNNGIGYIKISSFIGVNVAEHFLQALEQTKIPKD
ncbi:MAG: PDZ domain-containing protein [Candidatus Melainabacteria bacterium]|nr:MAG: PDZ domain-containing protein [Candidatus Melainabacteria bacterium]